MEKSDELPKEMYTKYRWVMAIVAGLLMTTSFISLSTFSILSDNIATTFKISSTTLTVLGIDSFSIGLFVAFFLGHTGLFDTKIKTGVLLSQIFLIVPQFIIPISYNLYLLVALRFFQGLMIMILALFSLQLSGWFRPEERAISLAFTLGAMTLGTAAGAFLPGLLSGFPWQESYYITGFVMLAGAIIYFAFARDAPELKKSLIENKKNKHRIGPWKNSMTWIMGVMQLPVTWTLFSLGMFLPLYETHLGYSLTLAGDGVIIWGVTGFIAAFIGAIIGDKLVHGKKTNREIFNSRLKIMTAGEALMGVGALLLLVIGGISFYFIAIALIFNSFLQMFTPNYWALPRNVFPIYLIGAGAFGMGLISNSADAIGPLVASGLTSHWTLVFGIMIAMALFGVVFNIIIMKIKIKSFDTIIQEETSETVNDEGIVED